MVAEMMGELDGLVGGPAWGGLIGPVGSGDADEDWQMDGPLGTDGVDNFEEEADAVFEAAAVVVGSLIGEGREEFVEQVAVSGVDFDEVEACGEGADGSEAECLDGGGEAGLIEGLGDGVTGRKGDGRGGNGLPGSFFRQEETLGDEGRGHASLSASVGELDAGTGSLRVEELGDALQGGNVFVFPDAEVTGGDAAFGGDGGGFQRDQGSAALGSGTEVDEMPVGGEAIFRRVLAHGGNADAIGELEGAELEGREEGVAHGWLDVGIGLRVREGER